MIRPQEKEISLVQGDVIDVSHACTTVVAVFQISYGMEGFDPFPTNPHRWLQAAGSGGVDNPDRAPPTHTRSTLAAAARWMKQAWGASACRQGKLLLPETRKALRRLRHERCRRLHALPSLLPARPAPLRPRQVPR